MLRGQARSWTLHFASNFEEAMKVIERYPLDAVISDIGMPDRDGFDLMETIRADARTW